MSLKRSVSTVWDYFEKLVKEKKVQCLKCQSKITNANGSTGAMINHLKLVHKILISETVEKEQYPTKIQKASTSMLNFIKRDSLEDIVSKLAAIDNISIRTITNSSFIRESISSRGYSLPNSESSVMKLIQYNFEVKKAEMIKMIEKRKMVGNKFSITTDEWTSLRRRRYLNINVHGENDECMNLGLVPILGSCNADEMIDKVKNHLFKFNINFESDTVCTTNDGAAMMLKYGRTCTAELIICLNHSIHLGVCDYIFMKRMNLLKHSMKKILTNMKMILIILVMMSPGWKIMKRKISLFLNS